MAQPIQENTTHFKAHKHVIGTGLHTIMNDCGCLSLCFRQDNINEIICRRDRLNAFEVVQRHAGSMSLYVPKEILEGNPMMSLRT